MSILSINGSGVYEREAERNWAAEYAKRLTDREAAERNAAIETAVSAEAAARETAVGEEATARAAEIGAEEAARVSKDNALADGTALEDECIKSKHITPGSVTTAKLADGAVTNEKIGTGAVTAQKIGAGAVTAAKIGAGAVMTQNLDTGAVTADKIDSGAVTATKLDTGAGTTAKIADGAVTTAKLDTGAVTGDKIADGTITAFKIADGAVHGSKLHNGAVSLDKLASDLRTYSTSPKRVGAWIDGTPIWRVAFSGLLTSYGYTDGDEAFGVLQNYVTDLYHALIINGFAGVYNGSVDAGHTVSFCITNTSGGFEIAAPAAVDDTMYGAGWIEFSCDEEYLIEGSEQT